LNYLKPDDLVFNKTDTLGQGLSISQKIYVFRYRATALYALTADSTGRNLLSLASPASWQFEWSITLRLDKSSPKQELIRATLAAIGKHGFYLTHAALQDLPLDLDAPAVTAPKLPGYSAAGMNPCPTVTKS